jgi:hypothetical protein
MDGISMGLLRSHYRLEANYRSSRYQENLVLILLYKHLPGLQAQSLVPANGEKLGRLGSSFVSLTDAALIGRTIIEVKPNTHRVFGTTFTAKYVDFVLRHDQNFLLFTTLTFQAVTAAEHSKSANFLLSGPGPCMGEQLYFTALAADVLSLSQLSLVIKQRADEQSQRTIN